jgi:hypothetical protein
MPDVTVIMPEQHARTEPTDTLKCLSVQQPWAHLIVSGVKDIENREWCTHYRGPVLIHAGARRDPDCFTHGSLNDDWASHILTICGKRMPERECLYPVKSIIGMATLADVVTHSSSPWFVGKYGFVFTGALPFKEPILYSGSLKLFEVSRESVASAEVKA